MNQTATERVLEQVRIVLRDDPPAPHRPDQTLLADLLGVTEERMRVNVGLVMENATLRKARGDGQAVDLASASTATLLAEIEKRTRS